MSRPGHGAAPGDRVVDRVEAGRSRGVVVRRVLRAGVRGRLVGRLTHQIIDPGEQLVRCQVQLGERTHRRPQAPHGGRRLEAVPDHVTDHQSDPAAGQGDHIEPVAADSGHVVGGQVAVRQVDGGLPRQMLWQQLPLEGEGSPAFPGEAPGVVDGHGRTGRELVRQGDFAAVEGRRGRLAGKGHQTEQAPPGPQGTTRVLSSSTSPPEERLRS